MDRGEGGKGGGGAVEGLELGQPVLVDGELLLRSLHVPAPVARRCKEQRREGGRGMDWRVAEELRKKGMQQPPLTALVCSQRGGENEGGRERAGRR